MSSHAVIRWANIAHVEGTQQMTGLDIVPRYRVSCVLASMKGRPVLVLHDGATGNYWS